MGYADENGYKRGVSFFQNIKYKTIKILLEVKYLFLKVVIHLKQMYEKRIKKAILGEGEVSLISLFSMDKNSETGYDIYLLCAIIADHVTLLTIFLPNFWAAGCS